MDLREFEAVIAVSELGSFSAAATALFISQPALTRRVALLEAELDLKLFIRAPRGVFLTDAGRALIGPARRALLETEKIRRTLDLIHDGGRGSLLISGVPNLNLAYLGSLVGRFQELHPDMEIRVSHARSTAAAIESVEAGTNDLAIVDLPSSSERVTVTALWEVDFLAVMARVSETPSPATSLPVVTAEMLRGRPWVHLPEDLYPCQPGRALFDMVGLEPSVRIETAHSELQLPIAIGGRGVAVVPRPSAMRALDDGGMIALPPEPIVRTVGLARRKDETSPAVARFLRLAGSMKPAVRAFSPKILEREDELAS